MLLSLFHHFKQPRHTVSNAMPKIYSKLPLQLVELLNELDSHLAFGAYIISNIVFCFQNRIYWYLHQVVKSLAPIQGTFANFTLNTVNLFHPCSSALSCFSKCDYRSSTARCAIHSSDYRSYYPEFYQTLDAWWRSLCMLVWWHSWTLMELENNNA